MGRVLLEKLRESLFSVMPVVLIALALALSPLCSFSASEIVTFVICSLCLVLGMALFSLGAEIAMTPMGEKSGSALVKKGSLSLLLCICFVMGLCITVAEPDLSVLAKQLSAVLSSSVLIITVGAGVGLFLVVAIIKIVFKRDLSSLIMFFYMIVFALGALLIASGNENMLATAFDSGGVTTGPITVPFIMALGVGIAGTIGGNKSRENSFGLVALCSVGPILAVLLLSLTSKGSLSYSVPSYTFSSGVQILYDILSTLGSVAISVGLIVAFFLILQFTVLKLSGSEIKRILLGICFTFVGLVMFLSAVEIGFVPMGYFLGNALASASETLLIIISFVVGLVALLAEPAVHVLNRQVEEITGGTVSKKSMMIALSLGVGISVCLSVIRVVYGFSLLYYLVPGYLISLGLSFFVPKIYTAIAFDSGGVASGPLTSSFILPFLIGACTAFGGNVLTDAFGVVAMVALTPLITIQILGFKAVFTRAVRRKRAMRKILDADDAQIINFM